MFLLGGILTLKTIGIYVLVCSSKSVAKWGWLAILLKITWWWCGVLMLMMLLLLVRMPLMMLIRRLWLLIRCRDKGIFVC